MRIVNIGGDIRSAFSNLYAQKMRTLLTALGIVFGVGSVIGMLSIGAGAREESLQFIENLGVRNILVESRPATSAEELQQRRRVSPGLTERDIRVLEANLEGLELLSPRRSLHPARILPKPTGSIPDMHGVRPSYATIHSLSIHEGRFFTDAENESSVAVCVLGQAAKQAMLGFGPGVGKQVKVNDTWLQVVGVLADQVTDGGLGVKSLDRTNAVFIPSNTFKFR